MSAPSVDVRQAILIALRGVGQVMFQSHAGTGLLFLAGIGVASGWTLLGALLGAILGPLVAYLLRFDRGKLEAGIYGFNATLVGLATLFFLRPGSPLTWGLLVVGCAVATVLTNLSGRWLWFPVYTGPFVVTTWAILLVAHWVAGPAIDVPPGPATVAGGGFWLDVLRGEAEVMLSASAVTGVLFLAGIALSDPRHAGIAVLGSVVGTAVALYHGDRAEPISVGIYGYNAALAAMALFLPRAGLTSPLVGAVVATLFTEFFPQSPGLPALTAPFVVAAWAGLTLSWAEDCLFSRT